MRRGGTIALLLACACPAMLPAQAPAAAARPSEAQVGRLMALLFPPDRLVAMNVASWREELTLRYADDPQVAAAERAHPGFRARLTDASLAEVARIYRAAMPAMGARLATLYRTSLDGRQVEDLTAFFATPTGRKLVAATQAGVAGSTRTTPSALREAGRAEGVASLGPEDAPALQAFAATSAAQAARTLSPRVAAISERSIADVTAQLKTAVPAVRTRLLAEAR